VIPLRQLSPSDGVQRAINELHGRAKTERFKGYIFVLETEDGEQVVGAAGIFASDLTQAAQAAQAGFDCLLGHSRRIETADPKSKLPRRLR
jgi:hypothetical protein